MILNEEPMPKGGVKELERSADGRRYLAQLQKNHELDILQPNNPKFHQVYGHKIKRNKEIHEQQVRDSKREWEESRERREFERSHPAGKHTPKKFYI